MFQAPANGLPCAPTGAATASTAAAMNPMLYNRMS
jgi:hypothetical protein